MKLHINPNIRQRINWSFTLLVLLFVINGIITIVVLNDNRKANEHISEVADPSLEALHDFRKVMRESLMLTTNWVFIRSDQEDKDALKDIQGSVYPKLKNKLSSLSAKWLDKSIADSLQYIITGFEKIISDEKSIMGLLQKFNDYNDPIRKFQAEDKLESTVIPQTAMLTKSLNAIMAYERGVKDKEEKELARSFAFLRTLISILSVSMVCLGIFFSIYMSKRIISPIHKIRNILNELGKGIIRKIDYQANNDEIGKMALSANNLSEKLQATATFAHEIGRRNFDMPFTPLSDEDTLGKALLAMRENLKTGETNLAIKNKELERKK